MQSASQAKVLLDPQLKRNADQPTTGFVQYAAMSTKVAPFDNVHCRRAVQYAVDKSAVQTARGAGQIAGGMLPPGIPGYDEGLDPYRTRSGKPQVDKARDELRQCGKPDGFATVIAGTDTPRSLKTAEAVPAALARAGITARIEPADPSLYARVSG
ncbi:ABC transporter substrate-binding protein [Dactylosporangium sp. NPDC049140]|uniref:ABC transporter substrate-binding protein n=1 Tax=Dactylosporangium sp. NPDC049140 TaxID=3155647 RepID=UPI0033CF154A